MDQFQRIIADVARRLGSQKVKEEQPQIRFEDTIDVIGETQRMPDMETMRAILLGSPGKKPTGVHLGGPTYQTQVTPDYPNIQQSWQQIQAAHPDIASRVKNINVDPNMGMTNSLGRVPWYTQNQINLNPVLEYATPEFREQTMRHELTHIGQGQNFQTGVKRQQPTLMGDLYHLDQTEFPATMTSKGNTAYGELSPEQVQVYQNAMNQYLARKRQQ